MIAKKSKNSRHLPEVRLFVGAGNFRFGGVAPSIAA